ncbi:Predicted PurR-regulated permease PerM [Paraoerskovia marina]|uniref:Predicted PurR-regulated permease PerM n=1 Tax=Paraoerskovia marina TaxID=545619 RepID=A0A1H1MPZ6_9CELL|nr:AI-2E family transporter [Paraoerskovia marina]SDR88787.1 Predicted PurR-regulated permease PerM [Paraoerskovia marina]
MTERLGLAPSTRIMLSIAAAIVVLAGMHAAEGIIGPMALAAVIVIIVMPVRAPLVRRGWPSWLATTMVIVVAYLILAVLLAMLVFAGVRFGNLVADYFDDLVASLNSVADSLIALGLPDDIVSRVTEFFDPTFLFSVAGTVSGVLTTALTAFFFVLAYAIFMSADAAQYGTARSAFGATRSAVIDRATAYNTGVRKYFVVNATFGLIVAVVDGFALWALGVPAPVVWAILAFVTNFIPNIGFILGLVPPMIMALVVGGWPLALAVVALYCVVNVVLQVLVQPKFVADSVSLSLTLSFVSVVFWTFIIGPLGAILAIPLTLLFRTLFLEPDPGSAWLRWLSGDYEARDPRPDGEGDGDDPVLPAPDEPDPEREGEQDLALPTSDYDAEPAPAKDPA